MADVDNLIEKLKAATEGDRDLDLEVFNALDREHLFIWLHRDAGIITAHEFGEGAPGNPVFHLESFTSSVDDALSLIPERWGVTIHLYLGLNGRAWASVHGPYPDSTPRPIGVAPRPEFVCAANSIPLALCIAAVQARQNMAEGFI
jgi:hypothetical protein